MCSNKPGQSGVIVCWHQYPTFIMARRQAGKSAGISLGKSAHLVRHGWFIPSIRQAAVWPQHILLLSATSLLHMQHLSAAVVNAVRRKTALAAGQSGNNATAGGCYVQLQQQGLATAAVPDPAGTAKVATVLSNSAAYLCWSTHATQPCKHA